MKIVIYALFFILVFFWWSISLLASQLITSDTTIKLEHGLWKSIFVHENYYLNPFSEFQVVIERDDDNILSYIVWWSEFWPEHDMFIRSDDSLETRVYRWWEKSQSWVYSRIVLKQDTFDLIDGVYTPRQRVEVTEYYRIEYSHDTTSPECSWTYFSHDELWRKTFLLQENSWFNNYKYWFFLCEDHESWCICNDWDETCLERNDRIISVPQIIPHDSLIENNFYNSVWLEAQCILSPDKRIFYDTHAPQFIIKSWQYEFDEYSSKEYVMIDALRYDGVDIPWKNYYNIHEVLQLEADSSREFYVDVIDELLNSNEWVSGISHFQIRLFKQSNNIFSQIFQTSQSFDFYNIDAQKKDADIKQIGLHEYEAFRSSFSEVGSYKMYISAEDFAGNDSRIGLRYDVIPWDIDPTRAIVKTDNRYTQYADFQDFYSYTITLRDRYWNIIPDQEIFQLKHDCHDLLNCDQIFQSTISNDQDEITAIDVYDVTERSDEHWNIYFNVRSFAPWKFSESFSFQSISQWEITEFFVYWNENTFLHLVTWTLFADIDWVWQDKLPIWETTDYLLALNKHRHIEWDITLSSDFENYILPNTSSATFTLSGSLRAAWQNITFTWIYDTDLSSDEHHSLTLQISQNEISPIKIEYVIDGYTVQRRLSASVLQDQVIHIWWSDSDIEPLRIIWVDNVTKDNNLIFSHSDIRNNLRREILRSIQTRVHGTTLWWVKYINGNRINWDIYRIGWTPDFHTLAVRDANVLIENDFNVWWSPVGIIVLKSTWYNVEWWYEDIWNLYISSNVSQIHAMVYTDGSVISTTPTWEIVTSNISQRETQLTNQLYLKWSVFSRNTIWWAYEQDNQFTLPGWRITENQDLAVQYDLEHLRYWNSNCLEVEEVCRFPNYTIIEYDSRIISSPPPFFNQ